MPQPKEVVNHMMENDLFSQWLGIEVLAVEEGYSKIQMTIRKEMINGFGIVHGGVAFSLGDSCFAFACNNRNVLSVALDTSINFTKPVQVGDTLIAKWDVSLLYLRLFLSENYLFQFYFPFFLPLVFGKP